MPDLPFDTARLPALLAAAFLLSMAGYWLGAMLQGRRLRELEAAGEQQYQHWQQQLEQLQERLHESDKRLGMARVGLQGAGERKAELEGQLARQNEQAGQLHERLTAALSRIEALTATEQALRSQLDDARQQLQAQKEAHDRLQDEHGELTASHVELKTTLERRQEQFDAQLQQLADSREQLGREFENVASRLFEEKSRAFSQSSQASIDSLLRPFREQIEGFQKRVNEVHDAAQQGNASLNTEIRKLLEAGLKMSEDASNLTSALKGDSQQRGAWGEAQLRRTLEMSGLVEEAHYQVQTSFRDAEGRLKQTDYLIRLPDGKHIIIDSKVTLNAYQRVVEAPTPEQEQLALNEHVRAVRRHIDDLAGKDYSSLPGVGSPDFVLMFMPVEPAYIEAMKHDRGLFEYGYRKNIVLVSHTTLIPVLRTVSSLWMLERSQQQAREISERAGDIFSQVCTVAERLGKLGNSLGAVGNHYNSVVTALAGQQGLYGKVERFGQLSAKAAKELPQLDTRHPELDTARLQLVAEALPEIPEIPDD